MVLVEVAWVEVVMVEVEKVVVSLAVVSSAAVVTEEAVMETATLEGELTGAMLAAAGVAEHKAPSRPQRASRLPSPYQDQSTSQQKWRRCSRTVGGRRTAPLHSPARQSAAADQLAQERPPQYL